MGITDFISRLKNVRQSGVGQFIACCPAHPDKSPSLSVKETQDGRLLIHCFAGCDAVDVVAAVGMSLADLYPEPLTRERLPAIRRAFTADEALACLAQESAIVAICAAQMIDGSALSPDDLNRLWLAAGRITTALETVHGVDAVQILYPEALKGLRNGA